jgi:protein-L-isoaspartate(D-aspartate) O-methyltransferase
MVATLDRAGAVRSRSVRRAFQSIPRELFVSEIVARDGLAAIYRPELALATAIDSRGMAISSSSAPIIMGLMLEDLQLSPGHRVLEVGAGTGYNAALLKYLVGDGGRVTSIDIESSFARRARRALAQAGYSCRIVAGDGRDGWAHGAPYDRIMVTAASDAVPQAWRDQLVDGGLIELPFRFTPGFLPQLVVTLRREGDLLRSVAVLSGMFMVLRKKKEPTHRWNMIRRFEQLPESGVDRQCWRRSKARCFRSFLPRLGNVRWPCFSGRAAACAPFHQNLA